MSIRIPTYSMGDAIAVCDDEHWEAMGALLRGLADHKVALTFGFSHTILWVADSKGHIFLDVQCPRRASPSNAVFTVVEVSSKFVRQCSLSTAVSLVVDLSRWTLEP